jgi:hypothetical protein
MVSMVVAPMAVVLGCPAWAAAQPGRVSLTWDAPAGCPPAAAVLGNVERTLAEPGQARTPAAATARVLSVPGEPWQAHLTLDVRGTRTERQFEAESCDALAAAAALIIALAVEDGAEPPLSPASASDEPHQVQPPPTETLVMSPPSPRAVDAWRWDRSQLFLTVNGIVDQGTMPDPPAFGFEAVAGRRWIANRWRLGALAGTSFFPKRRLSEIPMNVLNRDFGEFWLFNVSARGCLGAAVSRFEIGPCFGAELAAMHAWSENSNEGIVANSTQFWLSLLGSAVASWNVSGRLAVVLRTEVVVPSTRRSFGTPINNAEVYHVPASALRGTLGLALRF